MPKAYSEAEEEYSSRKKQRDQCPACRNRDHVNARSPEYSEAGQSSPDKDTEQPNRDDQKERHTKRLCRVEPCR